MINRENLKYYENILSIENKDVSLSEVYNIVTLINENKHLSFIDNVLSNISKDTSEIQNILDPLLFAVKENDYKNIVDIVLSNLNADINNIEDVKNILVSLLFAVKEHDEYSFYTTLMNSISNYELNLLENVLKICKHYPLRQKDIFDSFSTNQLQSKNQLLDRISDFLNISNDLEIVIFGSWYGSILIPRLARNAKRISCLDLDESVLKVSKNHMFCHLTNIDYVQTDVFKKSLSRYKDTDLIINTSCEHMPPMKEWPFWNEVKNNTFFALQSNNMYGIEGHTNCVDSIKEFKEQMPSNFKILAENQLEEERGTRFTIVGKISN